jgi:tetratricopeptide (TPR) repeat protein
LIRLVGALFLTTALNAADPPGADSARRALAAGAWADAAEACQALVRQHPEWAPGYDCLVRALLRSQRTSEAYAAADLARNSGLESSDIQTAVGRALFRRGDFDRAAQAFEEALRRDSGNAQALAGLARVEATEARFRTSMEHAARATRLAPEDAELVALAERETEPVLKSPYRRYTFKLDRVSYGRNVMGSYTLQVRINGGPEATLILDTGASGVIIDRKTAEKARLTGRPRTTTLGGFGDGRRRTALVFPVRTLQIGDLAFEGSPVSVLETLHDRRVPEWVDGLIGGDVFQQFVIAIDGFKEKMVLDPYPGLTAAPPRDSADAVRPVPAGFSPFRRLGHMILLATNVNGGPARWFVLDSGAPSNLIDFGASAASTNVVKDDLTRMGGIQGRTRNVFRSDRANLVFAGVHDDNINVLTIDIGPHSDSVGVELAGFIGMPVLEQYSFTIDYRNGVIAFRK